MTTDNNNVHQLHSNQPSLASHRGGSGGDGGGLSERITRLETHMQYLATKEDVQAVRTDVQAMRTEIASAGNKQLMWGVGILATVLLAVVGLLNLIGD